MEKTANKTKTALHRSRIKRYEEGLQKSLKLGLICALVASASMLWLLAASGPVAYLGAAVFWLSIPIECVVASRASDARRKLEQNDFGDPALEKALPGILSFFRTREGAVADSLLILSILCIVIATASGVNSGVWLSAGIFLCYTSLQFHCYYNGVNYRYMQTYEKNRKGARTDE